MANESDINNGDAAARQDVSGQASTNNEGQIPPNDTAAQGAGEKILQPEKIENGERVYAADQLENVPFKTTFAQKVFIAVSILILLAIVVTFHDADSRENQAAQSTFSVIAQPIINSASEAVGLRASWGYPIYTLNARTKEADIFVEFLHGPIPPEKAEEFGLRVCSHLARAYVQKGYMPRHLSVHVFARLENAPRRNYGQAIFNGNLDELVWEPSRQI